MPPSSGWASDEHHVQESNPQVGIGGGEKPAAEGRGNDPTNRDGQAVGFRGRDQSGHGKWKINRDDDGSHDEAGSSVAPDFDDEACDEKESGDEGNERLEFPSRRESGAFFKGMPRGKIEKAGQEVGRDSGDREPEKSLEQEEPPELLPLEIKSDDGVEGESKGGDGSGKEAEKDQGKPGRGNVLTL